MIKGFENLTYEITPEEERIMSVIIRGLNNRIGKEKAIKGPEIVESMNKNMQLNKKFTEVRLRKIINYIRSHGLLPVMASSSGYYVSYDLGEVQQEIQSMQQRAHSILSAANGLNKFLQPIK